MILPDIVHIDDVGMGESCRRLGFHPEFGDKGLIFPELLLQHLHRHKTVQLVVFCLIDISHSARTDPSDDLISFLYKHSFF